MAKTTISENWGTYTAGDYWVINNTWNRRELVFGVDFTQSVTFDSEDLSRDVRFNWDWGNHSGPMAAYPEIVIGYKPWNESGSTDFVSRVSELKTFEVSQDVTVSGDTDKFNVAYELWLTDQPLADETSITSEVMIWTDGSDMIQYSGYPTIGTYKDGNFKADIYFHENHGGNEGVFWDYIAVVARKDYTNVTVDVKDVFAKLVDLGVINKKDYINGYEFGSEVCGGKGQLKVNSLTHKFETFQADAGDNKLVGSADGDRICGYAGNDEIRGRNGDDVIISGSGSDVVTGGRGRDCFVFKEFDSTDRITDFTQGQDKIVIQGDQFDVFDKGMSKLGYLTSLRDGEVHSDSHFIYDRRSGELYYDVDGKTSVDDCHLLATFDNHSKLDLSDFAFR